MSTLKRKLITTFREKSSRDKKKTITLKKAHSLARHLSFNPNEESALYADKILSKESGNIQRFFTNYKGY